MKFLDLPVQVKLNIISHVSSIGDLAALSQSCRPLHHLCDMNTRKRFYHISIVSSDYDQSINKTFELLMEILKDPKLGSYVRELVQARKPALKRPYIEMAEQRKLTANDKALLRAAVQKAEFTGSQESAVFNMLMQNNTSVPPQTEISDFRYRLSAGQTVATYITQALAAIIISVSPNLESLVMSQPFTTFLGLGTFRGGQEPDVQDVHFPLDQFLRRTNANPAGHPYLQNLRKVYMIVSDGNSDGRFYESIDFLECTTLFDSLPSIESISADALYLESTARATLEPRSSHISRVKINHAALRTPEVAAIVLSCKELREFQYSIGGRSIEGDRYAYFTAKHFIRSLCPHKDSLEILDIDVEKYMFHFQPFCFDREWIDGEFDGNIASSLCERDIDHERRLFQSLQENIGSLKDFHVLKKLTLGIGFLIYFATGVRQDGDSTPRKPLILPEALPESLEYLCVIGYERGACKVWDKQIDMLMEAFNSGLLVNLKEIVGIEEMIPHAEDVEDPDDDTDKLWSPIYRV